MNYLFIPRMKVLGASASGSSYTIGIPSMIAWLGMMYAMQRKLREKNYPNITFKSAGVCYHKVKVNRFKPDNGYKYSIIGSRNPLVGKNAGPRSFMEVPTLNMDVDLIFTFTGLDVDETCDDSFVEAVINTLHNLRACGGTITSIGKTKPYVYTQSDEDKLKQMMIPGYTVIERRDLLINGESDNDIDRMLDVLASYSNAKRDDNHNFEKWEYSKKQKGWIIPIGVGYKGISPLGNVENQRNKKYPHRFVEAITTLGECKMPISLDSIDDMMWHYEYNEDEALYLGVNQKIEP